MKVKQYHLSTQGKWLEDLPESPDESVDLLIVFASGDGVKDETVSQFSTIFPNAEFCGATTAGEIVGREVHRDSLVLTTISLDKSSVKTAVAKVESPLKAGEATCKAIESLPQEDLRYIVYFVDGLAASHAFVLKGTENVIPNGVYLFGGFGADLQRGTAAIATKDGWLSDHCMVVGFYGDSLEIASGIGGQGRPFGPMRVATKAKDDILYELDNKPALDIIRKYVGVEKGEDLMKDGNTFHVVVKEEIEDVGVVRGFIEFLEEEDGIRLGGPIKNGDKVYLSMVSKEGLMDTAELAQEICRKKISGHPELALIVSCLSRIVCLGQSVEDEVEAALSKIDEQTPVTGFYSFGEIAPTDINDKCSVHNETLSMMFLREN